MAWLYEQKSGKLFHDGNYVATGYAGRDNGKNNPAMQNVKGIGTIPCGWYTMKPPINVPDSVGLYAIPLIPNPENEMFGRSSFYMHGDSLENPGSASHGCIVMKPEIRKRVWQSSDPKLEVISGIS